MTKTMMAPLVGMHYRPPATQVLALLPLGTELTLRPEPTNEYDAFAVQVLVEPKAVQERHHAALAEDLPRFGLTLEELLSRDLIHLGYIARTHSEAFAKALSQGGAQAHLGYTPAGKPQVEARFGHE